MGIDDVNQAIVDKVTNFNFLDAFAWILLILIIAGGILWGFLYYRNKKLYNKNIQVNELNGDHWETTFNDKAKNVKLGKGGFIIFHLKKLKTWKLGYGGRVGKNIYEFYILPDGYWYNGVRAAGVNVIDKVNGLIPIKTTNPLMRSQYTSLEKQIDSLGENKKSFWETHGTWVMGISFVLVAGLFLWFIAKEIGTTTQGLGVFIDKLDILIDRLNKLTSNIQTTGVDNGLVPALSGLLIKKRK